MLCCLLCSFVFCACLFLSFVCVGAFMYIMCKYNYKRVASPNSNSRVFPLSRNRTRVGIGLPNLSCLESSPVVSLCGSRDF